MLSPGLTDALRREACVALCTTRAILRGAIGAVNITRSKYLRMGRRYFCVQLVRARKVCAHAFRALQTIQRLGPLEAWHIGCCSPV
jgi:hypothetical protein